MVGVNGTGKTTTTGKLARLLVAEEHSVLLGAADTFRAAAADQLSTWGERVGVDVVRSDREGADPASVAFEAVKQGADAGVDVVIVDTAGRLQNKAGLMDELGKIKRVMEKPCQPAKCSLSWTQPRAKTECAKPKCSQKRPESPESYSPNWTEVPRAES